MKVSILTILLLSLSFTGCTQTDYNNAFVSRVIDGDTLQLANGEKVRLIGIDAPEMFESDKLYRDVQRTGQDIKTIQEMGREAYQFTKKTAEGRNVWLDFDVERRDKHGRLLAYVYVKSLRFNREINDYEYNKDLSHDIFFNREIIKQGYAQPMTIPPNVKYADSFQELYQQAREDKRGLWR